MRLKTIALNCSVKTAHAGGIHHGNLLASSHVSSVAGGGRHAVVSITFNKLSKDRATCPVRQPR